MLNIEIGSSATVYKLYLAIALFSHFHRNALRGGLPARVHGRQQRRDGLERIRGLEHRVARHQHVRARRHQGARIVGVDPALGMKDCPPKPGLTLMSRAWSKAPTRSVRVSTGVPGFRTMPALAPAWRMAPRVRWLCGSASWWMDTQSAPAWTNSSA